MVRALPLLQRPRTRGECEDGPRPCPWVRCRYHLAIAGITPLGGVRIVRGWDDGRETCALDVADEGEHTQAEVAKVMGTTRQHVDELEQRGKARGQRSRHG